MGEHIGKVEDRIERLAQELRDRKAGLERAVQHNDPYYSDDMSPMWDELEEELREPYRAVARHVYELKDEGKL